MIRTLDPLHNNRQDQQQTNTFDVIRTSLLATGLIYIRRTMYLSYIMVLWQFLKCNSKISILYLHFLPKWHRPMPLDGIGARIYTQCSLPNQLIQAWNICLFLSQHVYFFIPCVVKRPFYSCCLHSICIRWYRPSLHTRPCPRSNKFFRRDQWWNRYNNIVRSEPNISSQYCVCV